MQALLQIAVSGLVLQGCWWTCFECGWVEYPDKDACIRMLSRDQNVVLYIEDYAWVLDVHTDCTQYIESVHFAPDSSGQEAPISYRTFGYRGLLELQIGDLPQGKYSILVRSELYESKHEIFVPQKFHLLEMPGDSARCDMAYWNATDENLLILDSGNDEAIILDDGDFYQFDYSGFSEDKYMPLQQNIRKTSPDSFLLSMQNSLLVYDGSELRVVGEYENDLQAFGVANPLSEQPYQYFSSVTKGFGDVPFYTEVVSADTENVVDSFVIAGGPFRATFNRDGQPFGVDVTGTVWQLSNMSPLTQVDLPKGSEAKDLYDLPIRLSQMWMDEQKVIVQHGSSAFFHDMELNKTVIREGLDYWPDEENFQVFKNRVVFRGETIQVFRLDGKLLAEIPWPKLAEKILVGENGEIIGIRQGFADHHEEQFLLEILIDGREYLFKLQSKEQPTFSCDEEYFAARVLPDTNTLEIATRLHDRRAGNIMLFQIDLDPLGE